MTNASSHIQLDQKEKVTRSEDRREVEMNGEVSGEQISKGCPVTTRFSCIQTRASLALQLNTKSAVQVHLYNNHNTIQQQTTNN